jgi:ferredoxin
MTGIHVKVDADMCASSRLCEGIAAAIFAVPDDEDWAHVLLPVVTDPEQIKLAREARDCCPAEAITLEED